MSIADRLARVFSEAFQVNGDRFSLALTPEDVSNWDSIGHMNLVAHLEKEFGLQFEVDEIMEMASVGRIAEIVKARGVTD